MSIRAARIRQPIVATFGALMIVVACASCGGSPTSASDLTTTPYTGTLKVGAAAYFGPFTVTKEGTVTLTLTSLSPQSSVAIGLGLGQITGSSCVLQFQEPGLSAGQPLSFNRIAEGSYCAQIYDIGYLTQDNTFTVTVAHP